MPELNKNNNKVFIGEHEKLEEWNDDALSKIRLLIKNYLELDNVSFLFGAGSSIHLGSISIANIPADFLKEIKAIDQKEEAFKWFENLIKGLQDSDEVIKTKYGEINYPLEKLLNYLNALSFIKNLNSNISDDMPYLEEIIIKLKKKLFEACDLKNLEPKIRDPSNGESFEEENKSLKRNRYYFHEKLVKKILQRPLNLRRVNLFTTNYDLAFEYAFDNLGAHYIDGFTGFHNRTFKPETFDYDIYYPGSTTQGKVHRIEKTIKYYKLHGSITWVRTDPTARNIYGIQEKPLKLIEKEEDYGEIMIYPSATKKAYTLDFPYSELFRQFSATITQPQSVLFTYGYSFSDEHINDIIFQALSIPSFTLIIIDFIGTKNEKIMELKQLNDPRIIILEGNQLGDFIYFSQEVMPDLVELNTDVLIAKTMSQLIEKKNGQEEANVFQPPIEVSRSTEQQSSPKAEESGSNDDLPF